MGQKKLRTAVDFMAQECLANQVRMLNRVVTGIYEDEFRPLKLTVSQMVILALTAKRGQVRATELCRWLQIDASTLSRNIDRMRAKGWLGEALGDDQRSHPFRLTAEGEKLLRDAITAWERAQAKTVRLLGKKSVAHLKTITSNVRAAASTS